MGWVQDFFFLPPFLPSSFSFLFSLLIWIINYSASFIQIFLFWTMICQSTTILQLVSIYNCVCLWGHLCHILLFLLHSNLFYKSHFITNIFHLCLLIFSLINLSKVSQIFWSFKSSNFGILFSVSLFSILICFALIFTILFFLWLYLVVCFITSWILYLAHYLKH